VQKIEDILSYARRQADELEKDMSWERSDYGNGGYWKADSSDAYPRVTARAVSALEFFRQYAGEDSFWTQRAIAIYERGGNNQSSETGARALGDLLRAWADQVEAGAVEVAGSRAWAEIGIVGTDVMTQVRRLLEDRHSHPAAAIVLCGAALEIALRSAVEARGLELGNDRPSMASFTKLLRRERLITAQDVKDLEQCAGLRNLAAHGQFDDLSPERAGLMEQQTNILLRRLADLQLSSDV
jgi:uncharacterized protein YutE (UPF0331/DUF86 family)